MPWDTILMYEDCDIMNHIHAIVSQCHALDGYDNCTVRVIVPDALLWGLAHDKVVARENYSVLVWQLVADAKRNARALVFVTKFPGHFKLQFSNMWRRCSLVTAALPSAKCHVLPNSASAYEG